MRNTTEVDIGETNKDGSQNKKKTILSYEDLVEGTKKKMKKITQEEVSGPLSLQSIKKDEKKKTKKTKEKNDELLTSASQLNENENFGQGFEPESMKKGSVPDETEKVEEKKKDKTKQKRMMRPDHHSANFSLFHERNVQDMSGRQKDKKDKKKKEKREENKQDSLGIHPGKDSSEEDDMLFNFNLQPVAVHYNSSQQNCVFGDNKNTIVKIKLDAEENLQESFRVCHLDRLESHELGRKKKKNVIKAEGEQESFPLDRQKSTSGIAVDNNIPMEKTGQQLNGSLQRRKKIKDAAIAAGITEQEHRLQNTQKDNAHNVKTVEVVSDEDRNLIQSLKTCTIPTFSMAVAGSIVNNAQSLELATMLAGQIARAAAIFRIDEIVVFDDYDGASTQNYQGTVEDDNAEETGGLFMVKILKYLDVPQYLRRALIPNHRSLSSVGKLPPVDAPHHLRKHEWRPFREGVVLEKRPLSGSGSCVDIGLNKEVLVGESLKPGTRVTVAMTRGDVLQVVDREAVRQAGYYWGYKVRYASCLSAVFNECPFGGKYDYCIGTSEHGEKVKATELRIPKCKHLLVAFGGLSGLEESVELDKGLKARNITSLFDRYVNTCPNQGSRTIRTEEAILISLQFLQAAVQEALSVS